MAACRPDIPPHVAEVIRHLPPELKVGVKAAIRALCRSPFAGVPLQRELDGFWKYRVRRFRIVYAVDGAHRILRIVAVGERRSVDEELAALVRRR